MLEKNVFDSKDLDRILSSPSREEALKVLFDTDMAASASEEKSLERILEEDLLHLKEIISDLTKSEKEGLLAFLFLKFDALNLKVALKERLLNQASRLSVDCSNSSFDEIKLRLEKKEVLKNPYVERLVSLSTLSLGEKADSFSIEQAVDKAFLSVRLEAARKIGGLALEVSRLEIDICNLKNRVKNKRNFAPGGNLSSKNLDNLLLLKEAGPKSLDRFLEVFDLSRIIKSYQERKSEHILEKDLEKFLSNRILQKERERGNGVDKIIAFFTKKINAHQNIRLIMFSKESGIPSDKILESLLPL